MFQSKPHGNKQTYANHQFQLYKDTINFTHDKQEFTTLQLVRKEGNRTEEEQENLLARGRVRLIFQGANAQQLAQFTSAFN